MSYKPAMRHIVGVREANHHLAKHIKAVEERHKVVITRRGQPVARLTRDLGTDRGKDPKWQAANSRSTPRIGTPAAAAEEPCVSAGARPRSLRPAAGA